MGFCVIQRFAADLSAAHIAGIGLRVASHLSPYEEGDLLQLGFPIGRPLQSVITLPWDITQAGTVAGAGDSSGLSDIPGEGDDALQWTADGEAELKKIPFFVRGKVRRNTEAYARDVGCREISSETLYDAKAHFKA